MTTELKSNLWVCPFCKTKFKYFGLTSEGDKKSLFSHLYKCHEGEFKDWSQALGRLQDDNIKVVADPTSKGDECIK